MNPFIHLQTTALISISYIYNRCFINLFITIAILCATTWPVHAQTIDMGDGTVLEIDHGLQWLQDAGVGGQQSWAAADAWATGLSYAGRNDWRLPSGLNFDGSGPCFYNGCSASEMGHLAFIDGVTSSSFIINNLGGGYWTSTPPFPGSGYRMYTLFMTGSGNGYQASISPQQDGQPPVLLHAWAVRSAVNDDLDQDGYTFSQGDCNDAVATINPGVSDITCDQIDDDCDGTADEDNLFCACSPTGPDTNCDGLDNDCNGQIDDGYVIDAACGLGTCKTNNTPSSCVNGVETLCRPGTATMDDATCDGRDNNCNGLIDEDYIALATGCGLGACSGNTGLLQCQAGSLIDTCDPLAGASPTDIACNKIDDDCDGTIDEDKAQCGHLSGAMPWVNLLLAK